jgi:hypothetical protein
MRKRFDQRVSVALQEHSKLETAKEESLLEKFIKTTITIEDRKTMKMSKKVGSY